MPYIDIKVVSWQRMTLPDDLTETEMLQIEEAIKSEKPLPDWIYEAAYDLEYLEETEELFYDRVQLFDNNDNLIMQSPSMS